MSLGEQFVREMRSVTKRDVLQHQLFNVALALVIGTIYWFFQRVNSFASILVYTLVIGNLAHFPVQLAARVLSPRPLLERWLIFLVLLFGLGAAGGFLAAVMMYFAEGHVHTQTRNEYVRENALVCLFVTTVVGITMFAVITMRARLQLANRQLEDQVQLGTVRLQDLAAEATAAHEIQAHLIPTRFPQVPGVQVSGAWQPARAVGGDYFDVLLLDERRLAVCIADVSGKGMGAALLMANLQAAFRAFATDGTAPDRLCEKLNRALCSSIAPGKFVTFFYGILDVATLVFTYENAGHNQPMLLREQGAVPLEGGGTVLGLFPEAEYAQRSVLLAPGDCLLLTTDGITEASNPAALDDEFGEERLVQAARRVRAEGAYAVRTKILEEVTSFCDGQFQDDASLIVLTMDARGSG